jgi:hypothetical protein
MGGDPYVGVALVHDPVPHEYELPALREASSAHEEVRQSALAEMSALRARNRHLKYTPYLLMNGKKPSFDYSAILHCGQRNSLLVRTRVRDVQLPQTELQEARDE